MPEIRDIWLLAHHMIRSGRQIINQKLQSLSINSAEGNILLHLLTQGQGIVQEQLVEQLDISKPAVSRTLASLEAKQYITRQRDLKDKRAYRIWLTEKALESSPIIEQAYNHVFTQALRGISQDELDFFMKLFSRISKNFDIEHIKE